MPVDSKAVKTCQHRLYKEFDQRFDADIVRALLEMHNSKIGDVIRFIRLPPGAPEQVPLEGCLPRDYLAAAKHAIKQPVKPRHDVAEKKLFLTETTLADHLNAQMESYHQYVSVLVLLIKQRVNISSATKARVIAAALARRDHELAIHLLHTSDQFGLSEVLRAVHLLDGPRRVRCLQRRLHRLTKQGTAPKTVTGPIRMAVSDLQADFAGCEVLAARDERVRLSVSGALAGRLSKWVKSLTADDLTYYALHYPAEPWRSLADVLHLKAGDFALPWFLNYVYGGEAPAGSKAAACQNLNKDNVESVVAEHQVPYSYLHKAIPPKDIPTAVKVKVAQYEDLKTCLWWYEELACPGVDEVICARLRAGEDTQLSYGKLMERLLMAQKRRAVWYPLLIPVAEAAIKAINLPLTPPVAVLGDSSYSMDVAIRTATIIASLMSMLAEGDLKFFSSDVVDPPMVPRTIDQVVQVATTVKANGMTAPAAALNYYYARKEVIRVFVVVTDEIENLPSSDSMYFAELFAKYHTEVCPAQLVFVSFLEQKEVKGRMVKALEQVGVEPLQFRLDKARPDLTKLDSLIGILSSETSYFKEQTDRIADELAKGKMQLRPRSASVESFDSFVSVGAPGASSADASWEAL